MINSFLEKSLKTGISKEYNGKLKITRIVLSNQIDNRGLYIFEYKYESVLHYGIFKVKNGVINLEEIKKSINVNLYSYKKNFESKFSMIMMDRIESSLLKKFRIEGMKKSGLDIKKEFGYGVVRGVLIDYINSSNINQNKIGNYAVIYDYVMENLTQEKYMKMLKKDKN